MDKAHSLNSLFSQLGLPSDQGSVEQFIATHRPLPNGLPLYRADFWTPAQRSFLKEELIGDADWASAIDELNECLH